MSLRIETLSSGTFVLMGRYDERYSGSERDWFAVAVSTDIDALLDYRLKDVEGLEYKIEEVRELGYMTKTRIVLGDMLVLVDGRNEYVIKDNSVIALIRLDEYTWQIAAVNGRNFGGFARLSEFEIEQYTM